MSTKEGKKTPEQQEAKRQQTQLPRSKVTVDDGGSHAIDHLTVLDNEEAPDTNREPFEDIAARAVADLSFWNNSWTWNKASRSYGPNPEDSWFINPTPKLIGEVMNSAPLIHGSCEVGLLGEHKEQLNMERERHLEFLRSTHDNEFVSECLDLLTSYQGRYFEAVQQYLGRAASYDVQENQDNASEEQLEEARMRKMQAAASCRSWVAKLLALVEAYHEIVSDERAYNLQYDFAPAPDTPAFNIYKRSVTNALNKIGNRLTRSVKNGKLDAEKYRIPRPWLEEEQKSNRKKADAMLGDFV